MNLDGIVMQEKNVDKVLKDDFVSFNKLEKNDIGMGIENNLMLLQLFKKKYFDEFSKVFSDEEIKLLIKTIGQEKITLIDVLLRKFDLGINAYSINDYINDDIGEYINSRPVSEEEKEKAARKCLFNLFLPILEEDPYNELNGDLYYIIRRYDVIHLIMLLWFVLIKTTEGKPLSYEEVKKNTSLFN